MNAVLSAIRPALLLVAISVVLPAAAVSQERQFSEIPSILAVKTVAIADSDSELRRLVKEQYNE